jgi:hypothetical protein
MEQGYETGDNEQDYGRNPTRLSYTPKYLQQLPQQNRQFCFRNAGHA